jgi:hypothetical protein
MNLWIQGVNMQEILRLIIAVAFCLIIVPTNFVSAESETGHHEEDRAHSLELFLGNTHEDGEDGFSVGLVYEYRLDELFGIGGFLEHADGDFDKWIVGLPLYIHPYKGFRFLVAAGLENEDNENEFLFRTGVSYEFEFGSWAIAPEFNVDFVDGDEALVYGVSFAWKF